MIYTVWINENIDRKFKAKDIDDLFRKVYEWGADEDIDVGLSKVIDVEK